MTENPGSPGHPDPQPVPAATPAPVAPESTEPASTSPAPASVEPDAVGEGVAEPDDAESAGARPRSGRRRRVAGIVGFGVLAAAVLAGATCTVVTVQGADRDPGAPSWSLPKAAAQDGKEAHADGLGGMLLPYDTGTYERGPDSSEFGSDVELSGTQATRLRKESIKDLPRSQRQALERQLDRNPVKGMAMRSYLNTAGAPGYQYTMEIVLARMGSRQTVRSMATVQKGLLDELKVFRKGPEIKGYKDSASCFLPPTDRDEKMDTMVCTGYVGDVLVTATATAGKPLDKESAAGMLRAQLDRIKDPGASV
ncbi:hypothetical protein [Streptomyces sp. NPDC001068]|uniref:hypothetical protein n=1 Tax=Streptomyces sp. NPDC001068 TaxID=3364544 RepID=UPI00367A2B8F